MWIYTHPAVCAFWNPSRDDEAIRITSTAYLFPLGCWVFLGEAFVDSLSALGYPRVVATVLYLGIDLVLILLCLVLYKKTYKARELSMREKKSSIEEATRSYGNESLEKEKYGEIQ